MVSPRKSRRKSACFSSTTTSTPARASRKPSIMPGRPAAGDAAAGVCFLVHRCLRAGGYLTRFRVLPRSPVIAEDGRC